MWDARKKLLGGSVMFFICAGAVVLAIWSTFFGPGFDLFLCIFVIVEVGIIGLFEGYVWGLGIVSEGFEHAQGVVVRYDGISICGRPRSWTDVVKAYRNPGKKHITVVISGPDGKPILEEITKSRKWENQLILALRRRGVRIEETTFHTECQECHKRIPGPGPYCEKCAKEVERKRRIEELKKEAMA